GGGVGLGGRERERKDRMAAGRGVVAVLDGARSLYGRAGMAGEGAGKEQRGDPGFAGEGVHWGRKSGVGSGQLSTGPAMASAGSGTVSRSGGQARHRF